jgi:tetratricopeptide (TPR) repeat protein
MEPGCGTARFGRRKRWALAVFLVLIALALGVVAARKLWHPDSRQDPMRLGLLSEAWAEFTAKRYDRATAILNRRASEVAPTSLDWMLRARIAESEGRLADALDHLKQIPDSDPIGAQAWLMAGQIELARYHSRAAEEAYYRSVALGPDQVQGYRELAYLYAIQRRKAECDAQFRALAKRMPLDYVLAFAWGQNYCGIWDPNGARKVLSPFLAADPADRWSRLALAYSYRLTYEPEQAEAVLRALPDSDPDARAFRVQFAIDRGDIEAAANLARGGPAEHVRLNYLRGHLALNGNDPRQAAAYFRAALAQDPDDRDATHGLGLALRALGDPQAEEFLQIAFRHDKLKRTIQDSGTTVHTDPQLFYKLGEICKSLNRFEEARAWYRLAIKRDPLNTPAHQALTRLDETALEKSTGPAPKRDEGH